MASPLQIGTPRLALIGGNSYFLPPPDKGSLTLEWVEKAIDSNLVDGSESCRRLGWLPQLTMSWATYNDFLNTTGKTIGSANGNLLDFASLLAVLDNAPGTLKVSPGPSAGGFVINKTTISPVSVAGNPGITTGLKLTFRGGAICASKTLGAF